MARMALLKMSYVCYIGVIHTTIDGFLKGFWARQDVLLIPLHATSTVPSQTDTLKVVCESDPRQLA